MTSHKPSECPACAAGLWVPNCTWTATYPDPAPAYLDPVRDELATLREGNRVACARFESAERRVIELTAELALTRDTLTHRTEALQRVIDRPCPHCSATEETP
jgi:hypothetical protein